MKSRLGFVSNSSSSSFVIPKYCLSEQQMDQIRRHGEIKDVRPDDVWSISEDETSISGYTGMNNFYMPDFLREIGVNMNKVEWR